MDDASKDLDRRSLLRAAATLGGAMLLADRSGTAVASVPPLLRVGTRVIEVKRKPATVFQVTGPGGRSGITATEGDRFSGTLLNASEEPLQMHWHGQVRAPFDQDRARPDGGMLAPGQTDTHDFELTAGTHWMHSHTLSEQQLLAAPMVTREKDAGDVADVIVLLHDFAFRSPAEVLADLGGTDAHGDHGGGSHAGAGGGTRARHVGSHAGHGHGHRPGRAHANDVRYDAYLANDRTLDDPEVVRVEKGGRVRLRIINAGTATAFFVETPGLGATCVAVDGSPCRPIAADRFPLAQGQRIDLLVRIPPSGGAFPVLAQVEEAMFVTGIVLATTGAKVRRLASTAGRATPLVDADFESRLIAVSPLAAKRPDRAFTVALGEEPHYRWTLNGRIHGEHVPFEVRHGDRVELTFTNPTSMMHPMHLHGHHFQVMAIGGRRFAGPVRDTVIVPVAESVTIAFDAAHKGAWFLHCHHLYHMATGMMTEVRVT